MRHIESIWSHFFEGGHTFNILSYFYECGIFLPFLWVRHMFSILGHSYVCATFLSFESMFLRVQHIF